MGGFLTRVALRLVPRSWRDAVARDLRDEADTHGFGRLWLIVQALRAGVRLRWTFTSDVMLADLRRLIRSLGRTPGFTVVAILTFALGIGANVAVFSAVDRLMFRPLPYRDVGSLVQIHQLRFEWSSPRASLGLAEALTLNVRRTAESIEDLAYAEPEREPRMMTGLGDRPVQLASATYNLLRVLGVQPVLGRDFTLEEARQRAPVLLLSHDVWQGQFGGSPDVIGRRVGAGSRAPEIIGVLPRSFVLPSSRLAERIDALLLSWQTFEGQPREGMVTVAPIARLRPGATLDAARAEIAVIATRTEPILAARKTGVEVLPLRVGLFLSLRPQLRLVVAAVSLVLLMACANLSTLLLARGRARERDAALSSALGASRSRLIGMAVAEAIVLALVSTTVALGAFAVVQHALVTALPPAVRGLSVAASDSRLLMVTSAVALACAVIAAIGPAFRVARLDPLVLLQGGRDRAPVFRRRGAATLLVIEATLGVVLVAGAVMTSRNLLQMLFKDPGFQSEGVFLSHVQHGWTRADGSHVPLARIDAIHEVLRALPGIQAFGLTGAPIPNSRDDDEFWKVRGVDGGVWGIGPGVFEALRTQLRAGRSVTEADLVGRRPIAVLNERAVAALWPGETAQDALGRLVDTPEGRREVVGVVADHRPHPGAAPTPALFVPLTDPLTPRSESAVTAVVLMAPGTVLDERAFDAALDQRLGSNITDVSSLKEDLGNWLHAPRFQALLFGSFAAIAVLLAAVGLYATASLEVARRRHEMGVRVALGATARDIRRAVLRQTVRPVVAGSAAGLLIAWWAAQFLQAHLFEVDARDPWTFGLVAAVLITTALAAAWIPARRAARTDPAVVLKAQ